jgi:hypothetical protein
MNCFGGYGEIEIAAERRGWLGIPLAESADRDAFNEDLVDLVDGSEADG